MIDHIWSILCSQIVIDRDTNNLTIFNVVEQLNIKQNPTPGGVLPIRLAMCTFWVRRNADIPCQGQARYSFRSPSGRISSVVGPQSVDLTVHERLRSRLIIDGLQIEEPGRHFFDVEYLDGEGEEWQTVCSIPIMIIFENVEETETEINN